MSLVVQKFGGSSVADTEHIKKVAGRIITAVAEGNQVAVVVSAMGDTTDDLIDLANQVTDHAPAREMDILLTAGERISMSLLAMAVTKLGTDLNIRAKSFTGQQAGIQTTKVYGHARISWVEPERILSTLDKGDVAIIAGFQGINKQSNDVTTLGRGGSDTTAVAIAAAIGADICEIYSDVDGVFTSDPRVCKKAHKLDFITYEEMLELSASGAKILALRCVEYARRFNVKLRVRSSFNQNVGTVIAKEDEMFTDDLEAPLISGIAHDTTQSKITLVGIPDKPGVAAQIFETIAGAGVNVDMVVQNVSTTADGKTDISFTIPSEFGQKAIDILKSLIEELEASNVVLDDNIAKISVVGAGMKTNSGVCAKFFSALSIAGINIEMISTSEIRISVITRAEEFEHAVNVLHSAFGLDADAEAVVYAGTGR